MGGRTVASMSDTPEPVEATEAPVSTAVPVTPDASLIAAPEPSAPAAPTRPEGLPDEFWDDATGVKPEAFAKLAELQAAAAARAEGVPETVDGYKLEPDEPVMGPDGKPVTFDADDPLAKAILPALHEAGLAQAQVGKILRAYAAREVAAMQEANAAAQEQRAAEIAKLGSDEAAVKTRTSAVHGQLVAALGAEQAEALRGVMTNAAAFQALEALTQKLQGPAIAAAPLPTPAVPDVATRLYG